MHARAAPSPQPPRLAAAFLALSDADGDAATNPRTSPAVALATLAVSALLAFSAPLAWIAGPAVRPSHLPLVTPTSKAALPAPDDDGGG